MRKKNGFISLPRDLQSNEELPASTTDRFYELANTPRSFVTGMGELERTLVKFRLDGRSVPRL